VDQLEALADALLDFAGLADLAAWLPRLHIQPRQTPPYQGLAPSVPLPAQRGFLLPATHTTSVFPTPEIP
jgi:hypothetical protein